MKESDSDFKSRALSIVYGGLLLATLFSLTFCDSDRSKSFAFQGEYPGVVTIEMVNEEGIPYSIEAIEGQVCVWFKDGVSYKTAKRCINTSGGEIVAQIPDFGYYLVEVSVGDVENFIFTMDEEPRVDRVFPNIVAYPLMAKTYVLDNYYPQKGEVDTTPHGVIVQHALQECGTLSSLDTFNIGIVGGKKIIHINPNPEWRIPMASTDKYTYALYDIALSSGDDPILINMSFGQGLRQRGDTVYDWDEVTMAEKKDYKERYFQDIRSIILSAKMLTGKDFIIVKASGNDGVKRFDEEIISYLRKNLNSGELEFMEKHFLIVTAGEESRVEMFRKMLDSYKRQYDAAIRNNDSEGARYYDSCWRHYEKVAVSFEKYSNEMEAGHYDPLVTKVDISDFNYNGYYRKGTSFAAPRAVCYLSLVANEMNLTGAEVLKLAREVTKRDGEITKDALLRAAKRYRPNNYSKYGCLSYRLVTDENDMEKLELRNTCTNDIRVTGYLLNAIVPRGGDNTLDFDVVIKANRTVFVEGFIENQVTIKSVEEILINEERIRQDLVGVVLRDPSPNSYFNFNKNWSWTIKSHEISGITIKNESVTSDNCYSVNAIIHLKHLQLPVDVEVVIKYKQVKQAWVYDYLTVKEFSFPPQTNYSSYVDIHMDYDFFPSLVVKNNCSMSLFVAGAYTSKGETVRFVVELEPYESKAIAMGPSPDSYSIHFAYKE